MPYRESFAGYAPGQTPRYWCDIAGVFLTAVAPDGRPCLEQKTWEAPVGWTGEEFPFTMMGDLAWKNYTVSCEVRVDFQQPVHLLGRIQKAHKSGIGFCWADCYCLTLHPDGRWALEIPQKKEASPKAGETAPAPASVKTLLAGTVRLVQGQWCQLGLR